jgi:hypothetical protein
LPVKGFPETKVILYAKHRDRVRCFFTLERWRRGGRDSVWQLGEVATINTDTGPRRGPVIGTRKIQTHYRGPF